jgi:hypothetical protein
VTDATGSEALLNLVRARTDDWENFACSGVSTAS